MIRLWNLIVPARANLRYAVPTNPDEKRRHFPDCRARPASATRSLSLPVPSSSARFRTASGRIPLCFQLTTPAARSMSPSGKTPAPMAGTPNSHQSSGTGAMARPAPASALRPPAPFARSSAKTCTAMLQLPHFAGLPVPARSTRTRAKTGPAVPSGPRHQKKEIKNNHRDRATGRTARWGTMWRADTLPLRLCPILAAA